MKNLAFVVFFAAVLMIADVAQAFPVPDSFGLLPKRLIGTVTGVTGFNEGFQDGVGINSGDTWILTPVGDGSWYMTFKNAVPGVSTWSYRFLAADSIAGATLFSFDDDLANHQFDEGGSATKSFTLPVTAQNGFTVYNNWGKSKVIFYQPDPNSASDSFTGLSRPFPVSRTGGFLGPVTADSSPSGSNGGANLVGDNNSSAVIPGFPGFNPTSANPSVVSVITSDAFQDTTATVSWTISGLSNGNIVEDVDMSNGESYGYRIFVAQGSITGVYVDSTSQFRYNGSMVTDSYISTQDLNNDSTFDVSDRVGVLEGLETGGAPGGTTVFVTIVAADAYFGGALVGHPSLNSADTNNAGMESDLPGGLAVQQSLTTFTTNDTGHQRVFPVDVIFIVMGAKEDVIFKDGSDVGYAYSTPYYDGKLFYDQKVRTTIARRSFR